jgi:acyl-CoA thioesterase
MRSEQINCFNYLLDKESFSNYRLSLLTLSSTPTSQPTQNTIILFLHSQSHHQCHFPHTSHMFYSPAAFDTIDHTMLIHRPSTGTALDWFTSYLTSRPFTVVATGHSTSSLPLSSGMPQGSVLGPILLNPFTISLNSLINSFSQYFIPM